MSVVAYSFLRAWIGGASLRKYDRSHAGLTAESCASPRTHASSPLNAVACIRAMPSKRSRNGQILPNSKLLDRLPEFRFSGSPIVISAPYCHTCSHAEHRGKLR